MTDPDLFWILLVLGGIIALIVANSKVATEETKATRKVDNKKSRTGEKIVTEEIQEGQNDEDEDIFFRPKHRDVFGKPNRTKKSSRSGKTSYTKEQRKINQEEFFNRFKKLGISGKARIVKDALKDYPREEFEELSVVTKDQNQISKICKELNNSIRSHYRAAIMAAVGKEYSVRKYKTALDTAILEIIEMGFQAIKIEYGLDTENKDSFEKIREEKVQQKTKGRQTRLIKKSNSWKEIKDKL